MDRGHQAEDPRKTDDRTNVDHPLYWTHIRRILLASGASFNDTEDEAGALTSNQERGGHTHAHVPCPALKRVIRHFYGIGIGIGPFNQSGGEPGATTLTYATIAPPFLRSERWREVLRLASHPVKCNSREASDPASADAL